MTTNANDERFDEMLRRGLRAEEELDPISGLAAKAMTLAGTGKRAAAARSARSPQLVRPSRSLQLATALAAVIVTCIVLVGGRSVLQTLSAFDASDAASIPYISNGTNSSVGFMTSIIAAMVVLFALVIWAIQDSVSSESQPCLPLVG